MKFFICLLFAAFCVLPATHAIAGDVFDTKAAQGYINKGRSLMLKKQYDKAIEEFNEALAIDPDSAEAMYLKGYSRYEQRKMPMAYDDFSGAYETDWNYAPAGKKK
ncbi:MAG: tetratricopeptide repeat protein [Nitrospirota bacterium]|nr:tetratricopeptide repeat protein [Nitrospirota bacterium]